MRIRKHAARILSSLSIPAAQSRAAAAAAEAPGAAAGRELEMHVCELNQSPWDAMAFTPPRVAALYHYYQETECVDEDDGFLAGATLSGQGEEDELAAAVSDVIGIAAARSTWRRPAKIKEMADGSAEEEEKRERKMEPRKRSSSQNTKKIKRKVASSGRMESTEDEKVKMELESASAATAATTCKKSDGKGWHCKRAALRPHSLCEYHLTQVRSYYNNGGSTTHALALPQHQHQQPSRKTHGGGIDAKQNAALIPDKKKNSIKKTTSSTTKKKDAGGNGGDRSDVGGNGAGGRAGRKPASDFYYYYSGFGPWRRKRRSGGVDGDRGAQEAGNVDDASDGDDDRDGGRDGVPSSKAHDQAPDDLDDDEEDMDGRDEVRRYEGDDVAVGRRRGRKPIKARSLKSLL